MHISAKEQQLLGQRLTMAMQGLRRKPGACPPTPKMTIIDNPESPGAGAVVVFFPHRKGSMLQMGLCGLALISTMGPSGQRMPAPGPRWRHCAPFRGRSRHHPLPPAPSYREIWLRPGSCGRGLFPDRKNQPSTLRISTRASYYKDKRAIFPRKSVSSLNVVVFGRMDTKDFFPGGFASSDSLQAGGESGRFECSVNGVETVGRLGLARAGEVQLEAGVRDESADGSRGNFHKIIRQGLRSEERESQTQPEG
jgi:hypothetical protein